MGECESKDEKPEKQRRLDPAPRFDINRGALQGRQDRLRRNDKKKPK